MNIFTDYAFPKGPADGLTKRELFAAMAMQSIIVRLAKINEDATDDDIENEPDDIAGAACEMADALIAALSTEPTS